jgi:hypothetical protein
MRPSPPLLLLALLHFALLSTNAAAAADGNGTGTGDLRGDAMALLALKVALGCRPGALRSWSAANAGSVCAWTGVRCGAVGRGGAVCMKDGNVVGRGGAGVVYAGRTRSGGAIAVKRLQAQGGAGDDRGFKAEVRTLGSIRHRNIVRLLAFCTNRDANVLVYEYMGGGSLGEVLHGNGKKRGGASLAWERRYRIALEAARGLCYLHHDCTPMIVHRDVKSNNILLGDNLEARVADFGLAKFLRRSSGGATDECMSAVAGSYGYIAPGTSLLIIVIHA